MSQEISTTESAIVKKSSKMSVIWILPILAAIIGIWMIVNAVMTAGINIQVQFESADGIVVGKTEVRYKGLVVGVVKNVNITKDMDNVIAHIEMDYRADVLLKETTAFWIVRPEVSLSQISGLDTVFSGNYIAMAVGEGATKHEFVALDKAAPISEDAPGLHISVYATNLGSVAIGSQVFYKKIAVGKVIDYELEEDNDWVKINLLIEKKYKKLVKVDSRFWNASGIDISGSLSGFHLRTESLGSIVAGGIAFYNPNNDESALAENSHTFNLYDTYDDAKAWFEITLRFDNFSAVTVGKTKVRYAEHDLGFVKSLEFDKNSKDTDEYRWVGKVFLDPEVAPYITESTKFWLDKPIISLDKMDSFNKILEGTYIAIEPGIIGDKPKSDFTILDTQPINDYSKPGLHLQLLAKNLNSINAEQGVYYKRMKVGNIEGFELAEDNVSFNVHVYIEEKYQHLVNENSVFFEDSGFELTGNLQSFSLKSRPLQALLVGGISFHGDVKNKSHKPLENGAIFPLYHSRKDARYSEKVYLTVKNANKNEINANITRLMYQGEEIGMVSHVKVTKDLKSRIATIKYDPKFTKLFVKNSAVWMVEPKISAGSLTGLDALVKGAYLVIKQGDGTPTKNFYLSDSAPASRPGDPGLQLIISSDEAGSITVGTPVTYLQQHIGYVETVNFNGSGKNVDITLTIDDEYRHFVRDDARFYQGSGINVAGNITDLDIRTESLASVIRGGIALLPSENSEAKAASEMQKFKLFASRSQAILNGYDVQLEFDTVVDLQEGAPVKFNNHVVGNVNNVAVNNNLTGTKVSLSISKKFPALFAKDAKFWLSSAQIGLTNIENPQAILTGNFISVVPGESKNSAHIFSGLYSKPIVKSLTTGLNIGLRTNSLGSLKVGDPIYYRQIKVGKVIDFDLTRNANAVIIYANIDSKYQHLLNENSRFWNASGIDVDAGIFSGIKVRTESLESILSGGLAFASPAEGAPLVNNRALFDIFDEPKKEWLDWQINK
ncbi:MlaD family protein [Psychromonas sp. MME2]|uniref:PqiB family protein n=1 Tax=unclassified Psychromonas TaxID=2614957 RepID=UPI00339CD051